MACSIDLANGGECVHNLCTPMISKGLLTTKYDDLPRASPCGHRATHAISASKKSPQRHSSSAFGLQPACTALSFQQSCYGHVSEDHHHLLSIAHTEHCPGALESAWATGDATTNALNPTTMATRKERMTLFRGISEAAVMCVFGERASERTKS
jgi:hypothetical protein